MTAKDRGAPGSFPPELVVRVKAIACELPAKLGVPLSRRTLSETRLARARLGTRRRHQRHHHLEMA
jgi:hypothetical protein